MARRSSAPSAAGQLRRDSTAAASLRITRSQDPKPGFGAYRGRDSPNLPFARSSRNPSHRKGTRTYQLADAHGRLDHGDLGFYLRSQEPTYQLGDGLHDNISFVPEVLPIAPRPIAGELISSWLLRVSFASGLTLV